MTAQRRPVLWFWRVLAAVTSAAIARRHCNAGSTCNAAARYIRGLDQDFTALRAALMVEPLGRGPGLPAGRPFWSVSNRFIAAPVPARNRWMASRLCGTAERLSLSPHQCDASRARASRGATGSFLQGDTGASLVKRYFST